VEIAPGKRLLLPGDTLVPNNLTMPEDRYRLCYIRGPEGIIVALAEQL
jgi:hypothetical protein